MLRSPLQSLDRLTTHIAQRMPLGYPQRPEDEGGSDTGHIAHAYGLSTLRFSAIRVDSTSCFARRSSVWTDQAGYAD